MKSSSQLRFPTYLVPTENPSGWEKGWSFVHDVQDDVALKCLEPTVDHFVPPILYFLHIFEVVKTEGREN